MRPAIIILASLGSLLAGCSAPLGSEEPTAAGLWLRDTDEFHRQWDTALKVLRQHRFIPDRQDSRAGVITTLPMTCGQSWEFWRQDAYHPYYRAEDDLHTIRRLARVEFERRSELGEYQLRVYVDVERLSMPERATMLASGAMDLYGTAMPTTAGRPSAEAGVYWVSLGRDEVLERRLLAEMMAGRREAALGVQPPSPVPPLPEPIERRDSAGQPEPAAEPLAPELQPPDQPRAEE
jgi:hypothetical protein